jgi:nitrogen fixation/metabolism regulation signal transduction histidine kinase
MKLSGKLQAPEELILNKSVKMIVDQVDAMKRLVNEFRDYARLPQAQLVSLDLNALVGEVVQLYGTSLDVQDSLERDLGGLQFKSMDASGLTFEASLDASCPEIKADPLQLRQVVHNLIQNAQDASEGKPTRHVRLSTQFNAASARVRLRVEDSGGGFPDFILKRAFEPYVTTKSKGTGLGLAVVKKIADDHGARITLKNLEAEGVVLGAQVSLSFAVAQSQQNVV